MKKINCVAADLGASGGKMAKGSFDGEKLTISNYIDFANKAVETPKALYWDIFGLYNNILAGMTTFASDDRIDSIAIDAWGASYGLLDKQGRLLEPVYHYRDNRTIGTVENLHNLVGEENLFKMTGCQCNRTYTLPQLYSYKEQKSKILEVADKMLFVPDLLTYFLSGEAMTEMSIGGTSALFNTEQEDWCQELFEKLQLPTHILTDVVDAGTICGKLRSSVGESTQLGSAKVIATTGHDSAAAVAAIPGFGENKLYISIGTNISMGVETTASIVSKEAFESGFKNTGGIGRRKIVYRDFAAFWLMNELLRSWHSEGKTYSYEELIALAEVTKSKKVHFDLEQPEFNNADGDIRKKINAYLSKTNQKTLETDGEYVLCILESIALKISHYARLLKEKLNIAYTEVYVINGGSRNKILVQLISDALEVEVKAGMHYATLAGNILTQLYAQGHIQTIEEMRELSKRSFEMKIYEPKKQAT